ncbi:MAG: Lar family restriction alleviation protein [Clostridia bacterium]|nr:Lar family restriction alleviation protein [Clostridia bacterium]
MSHAIKKIRGVNVEFNPCPFCGGRPEWVDVPGSDYIMRCSSCHASTKVARWTPKEAATDWNNHEIVDDNFNITEDEKIDVYLADGIKKVLFSEYSNIEPFPTTEGGFLCSAMVILTDKILLHIEPEGAHLLYDEICSYGHNYYIKPIAEANTKIQFIKSQWRKESLRSLVFICGNKTITISANAKHQCLIVNEE